MVYFLQKLKSFGNYIVESFENLCIYFLTSLVRNYHAEHYGDKEVYEVRKEQFLNCEKTKKKNREKLNLRHCKSTSALHSKENTVIIEENGIKQLRLKPALELHEIAMKRLEKILDKKDI